MAWKDVDPQVQTLRNRIRAATDLCRARLDAIDQRADDWADGPAPDGNGNVGGFPAATVKGWMATTDAWLRAELEDKNGATKRNLLQTFDELDQGGGGGAPQAQKPGKPKGKKPVKKPAKKPGKKKKKKKKGNA